MSFFSRRVRMEIEGIMPERALLRLKRSGISLYNVKKIQKNRILLSVNAKEVEKVFAFYPNVCYNSSERITPYVAKNLGFIGFGRWIEFMKARVGLILGGLLCVSLIGYLSTFTFGVKFVGSDIYAREGKIALEKAGNKPFTPYKRGREDVITSTLLSLDGVEYCSVKKEGLYIRVEMRFSPFLEAKVDESPMQASHSGVLRSLTVLKGTPIKKVGDEIAVGDILVENAFYTQEGEQVRVEVIARAVIDCVKEGEIEAKSEEEAFAKAYLDLGLLEKDEITQKQITQISEGLYSVEIGYRVIEKINL